MSQGRRKKKNKQVPQNKLEPKVDVSLPTQISAEEMQHILARAIVEADEIKEQRKQEQRKAEIHEWQTAIGYKEYNDKNVLIRGVKTFWNAIVCLFRVCFIRKKHIKGDRISFNMMKMLLCKSFDLIKICLNILTAIFILYIPLQYIVPSVTVFAWHQSLLLGLYGLLAFMFSRMFRMASIEVEKIEDRNYLFGLFASVTAIVSIVIAIIAIVIDN